MAYHLNVIIDQELFNELEAYLHRRRLHMSAGVRDLLRSALKVSKTPQEAGWREGYTAAYASVQRRVNEALRGLDPTQPDNDSGPDSAPAAAPRRRAAR